MPSLRRKENLLLPTHHKADPRASAKSGWGVLASPACRSVMFFLSVLFVCAFAPRAYGSVGVVLNESLHESMDRITGTGHTAVYFSNICPQSPVKLRLCRPGELGSVMSTYINIGEDRSYGWNIVALSVYLFGVEDPENRPLFGTYKIKRLLEDRYREQYLVNYCTTMSCQTSSKAEWREMVAATLIRGVYIFAVDTSEEQDRNFIEEFNASANKDDFNGFRRNCADFTRKVIDDYFPHAVRRDYINDFGMTSPKAVARTFTQYAMKHPELNFRAYHFAQVPGTIKRSSEVRAGTEQLYRSKKWLVPMVIFADHELPVAAASYLIKGRFSPEGTFEKHAEVVPGDEILTPPGAGQSAVRPEARLEFVGTSKEWKDYRSEFAELREANKSGFDEHELSHLFKNLDHGGTPSLDANGSVWMEFWEDGEPLKLGLSANNGLMRDSNRRLEYEFLLARTQRELKSPKHSRETMHEFQEDWAKLQRASSDANEMTAGALVPERHAAMKVSAGHD